MKRQAAGPTDQDDHESGIHMGMEQAAMIADNIASEIERAAYPAGRLPNVQYQAYCIREVAAAIRVENHNMRKKRQAAGTVARRWPAAWYLAYHGARSYVKGSPKG